jgi:chromosome segregation ATPase
MTVVRAGIAAGLVVVAGAFAHARQAAPPAQTDVLPALLEEVKGLRAAMEQMASAGPRIQLFTSRLQLQETRITNMIRRLDSVRDNLATAQNELNRLQGQQKELETGIEESRIRNTPEGREEARQGEYAVEQVKKTMAIAKANVDRYASEEAQLTADIATEQARWTDINARLDEMEKLLSSRR